MHSLFAKKTSQTETEISMKNVKNTNQPYLTSKEKGTSLKTKSTK